ncbi:hypothetical protein SAY87_017808 [Trapa incisa]|uniref:Uncharacterized protein n=1 Tax=Trapa incisa TaxID=236973 RepID=A0AAN7LAL2_9MYRT|nr:hypothetical protein SAY87_017808 [Trapa incisa]
MTGAGAEADVDGLVVDLLHRHLLDQHQLLPAVRKVAFNTSLIRSPCHADGYDPLDPHGNVTIKWDIMQANGDSFDVNAVSLFI